MAEQKLDRAQIGSRFEQMSSKTVPQSMRMDLISESCSCRGFSARCPNHFAGDGSFASVPAITRKQPQFWWPAKPMQVALQFLQPFWAQHDIAVFPALPALDVNDHAFLVDVADLQMRQLSTSQASCVQSHQKDPVEQRRSRIDKPCNLLRA